VKETKTGCCAHLHLLKSIKRKDKKNPSDPDTKPKKDRKKIDKKGANHL